MAFAQNMVSKLLKFFAASIIFFLSYNLPSSSNSNIYTHEIYLLVCLWQRSNYYENCMPKVTGEMKLKVAVVCAKVAHRIAIHHPQFRAGALAQQQKERTICVVLGHPACWLFLALALCTVSLLHTICCCLDLFRATWILYVFYCVFHTTICLLRQ